MWSGGVECDGGCVLSHQQSRLIGETGRDRGRVGKGGKRTSPIYLNDGAVSERANVAIIPRRRRRLIAFSWYGGKFSHLGWLLPLLPTCHHYCEPFGGSAAVLLNRDPSPIETYNDIDGEVVNFFRVLREHPKELIRLISLTPYSREEYCLAVYGETDGISDIERARRFYIKARQTRVARAQTASLGSWIYNKTASSAGMSHSVSAWLGGVGALEEVAQRLIRVQIENRPAFDVIRLYDSPETLFYCDPPYLHATRVCNNSYRFEMDDEEHRRLAQTLNECKGKVAVSGYDHPLMDELFPSNRWFKTVDVPRTLHSTKGKRQEVLWTNYDPCYSLPLD